MSTENLTLKLHITLTGEYVKLFETLKEKEHYMYASEEIRQALKALAEKLGVPFVEKVEPTKSEHIKELIKGEENGTITTPK